MVAMNVVYGKICQGVGIALVGSDDIQAERVGELFVDSHK